MSSVHTNPTAVSALRLLGSAQATLDRVATKVATGRAINTASDNAAYWSIAKAMTSTGMSLSAASDAGGLAAATADTAALGLTAAGEIVSQIQSKLILAREGGADKTAINAEITQLKQQLGSVTESSSFSGENWLTTSTTPTTKSLVASVSTDGSGISSVNTIDFDTATTTLTSTNNASDGLLTKSWTGTTASGAAYDYHLLDVGSTTPASGNAIALNASTTPDEIDGMIAATSGMMSAITDAGAKLGATSSRIASNTDFLQSLQDTITSGVGRMVDADMAESAVQLKAAEVSAKLGAAVLNIANNQNKALMALFR